MLAMDKVVGLPIKQEAHTSSCVGVSTLRKVPQGVMSFFLPPLKRWASKLPRSFCDV